jgi:hypothetical protein
MKIKRLPVREVRAASFTSGFLNNEGIWLGCREERPVNKSEKKDEGDWEIDEDGESIFMRRQRRYRTKWLLVSTLFMAGTSLVGCSPVGGIHYALSGQSSDTSNQAANSAVGGSSSSISGSADSVASGSTQASNGSARGAAAASVQPFGGGSFDPAGYFDLHDDNVYVTEVGSTVYVTWESYNNHDEVYTSIAKDGQWIVRDKPVYSLESLKNEGNWSKYQAGNELAIVNPMNNTSSLVLWDENGNLTLQQALYKGWVAGDFAVSVDGSWGIMLHLPYGAPNGGARYDLFLPSQPTKPQVITTATPQFTGALYALDTAHARLYEVQTTKSGDHVLDVYGLNQPASQTSQSSANSNVTSSNGGNTADTTTGSTGSTGSNGIPVNTDLLMDSAGQPLQQTLPTLPNLLKVSPQGTVYTLSRSAKTPDSVSVTAYNRSLTPVSSWTNIKLANPYVQNVQLSVNSGTPYIYGVWNDNGQAALEQIPLK